MPKVKTFLCAALVLAMASLPGLAATRSVPVPLSDGGANNIRIALLGSAGDSQLFLHFTLPADYKKDTPVFLRLTVSLASMPATCGMLFGPTGMTRYRPNAGQRTGLPVPMGMVDGTLRLIAFSNFNFNTVSYKIKGLTGGAVKGQRAGDGFFTTMKRFGDDASDSCANVVVVDAQLVYTSL